MSSGASQTREDFTPDSRDPEAQADGFAHVRNAHESEMAEDYVELIAELIEAHGGHVGAESAGNETRIWFTLPA